MQTLFQQWVGICDPTVYCLPGKIKVFPQTVSTFQERRGAEQSGTVCGNIELAGFGGQTFYRFGQKDICVIMNIHW